MTNKTKIIALCCILLLLQFACKKDNDKLCGNYECLNGGDCINNECICEIGYTGEFCEMEHIPSSMQISKITVTNFPEWGSSNNIFTSDPNPDIYVQLFHNNNLVYSYPTNYDEAMPNTDYEFKPFENIVILEPDQEYTLILMDRDDDPDDVVAEQTFLPYLKGLGFPKTVIINEIGDLSFELEVQYSF